ncbi:type II secretion system protein GspM [Sphingomonas soli]|uniref:type II secretion system protein GspM n=1 Tax=Sphingomonas soli TaxID=266127 RepID=UPI000830749F|nr:type II secretion system protein GspM [Sphingomonas soli]
MKDLLARFGIWWSALSHRERILTGTMAALIAAVVLVYGVIKPLQAARADAIADIHTYETLNARILAAGTLTRTPVARRQGEPLKVASDAAASLGLAATPEATAGGVRVVVADASYDNLMAWLADLAATSDLRATRATIQRGNAPGRVSAVVDFGA